MGQLTYKIIIKKEHVRKERNMSKRVYISADYSESNGDRAVVDELHKWGKDKLHKVDYVDTAEVISGSVSENPDCRPCDLKKEFNSQINVSSAVVIVIGDKTASRTAGSVCKRNSDGLVAIVLLTSKTLRELRLANGTPFQLRILRMIWATLIHALIWSMSFVKLNTSTKRSL